MIRPMIFAVVAALTLAGCKTTEQVRAERLERQTRTCEGYGFKRATPKMAECIQQEELARRGESAANRRAAQAELNRPTNCTSTRDILGNVHTSCY